MTDLTPPPSGLSAKRLFLVIATVLVGLVLMQSLLNSWHEPQVASQLELYQTDLLLQGSAWKGEGLPEDQWPMIRAGLLGKEPVATAQKQYEEVRQRAVDNLAKFADTSVSDPWVDEAEEGRPLPRRRPSATAQQRVLIDQLDLRLGLMEAYQGQVDAAISRWGQVRNSEQAPAALVRTADTLMRLWQGQPTTPEDEAWLRQNLQGWFEYRALDQLLAVQGRPGDRQQLQAQEQRIAQRKLLKLVLVSGLPTLGALVGVGLMIGLLLQRLLQGEKSLLGQTAIAGWAIPWDAETIWQVLILGFFFVGQILLPLVLAGLGLGAAGLSNRGRAFLSLGYYLLMAAGGLGVLWWSIRPYRPLPAGLFRLKPSLRGVLWGVGGYLVALPLMFGVALLNERIWQGQGGSNPLLQTVLEERDPVALGVFFITAALAAPVFEETLFRGFLLPSLTKYMAVGWAIALSGLIFAAAHLSLSEVLPLTLLGCMLGLVYTRSGNLLSPMLLHSLWNSATMLGLLILGS
ncbi:MAG TPA: CPBP family intramembrane metalloprotease [Leptolyngbyaceae cyanobacterium M65_K2018_010]|nr:CPBP family intramembrane metalloprotease [Leptolyngbyaceae cyanobacterium M65_K2018_010]